MTWNPSLDELFKLTKLMVSGGNTCVRGSDYAAYYVGDYMAYQEVNRIRLLRLRFCSYIQVASWFPEGAPTASCFYTAHAIKIALYDLRELMVLDLLANI